MKANLKHGKSSYSSLEICLSISNSDGLGSDDSLGGNSNGGCGDESFSGVTVSEGEWGSGDVGNWGSGNHGLE